MLSHVSVRLLMNKFTLLASAIAMATATSQVHAEKITGQVVNEKGQVVSDAVVKIMGTNSITKTDELGAFSLTVKPGDYELHITALNYVHKNVNVAVANKQNQQVDIQVIS